MMDGLLRVRDLSVGMIFSVLSNRHPLRTWKILWIKILQAFSDESAKRRLELEGYQSNNLVMPGYHEYTVETEICTIGSKGCTEQEVFDQLRRFPAPQRFGSPDRTVGVKTGDRSFALMVGQVVHWVGRRMLTNTTIENRHLLDPGVVIREVITTGNKIIIRTSGYGTGPLPQINSGRPSKLIWSDRTDSKIVAAIRKKSEEK